MATEDLYKDILYGIKHNVGTKAKQLPSCTYIQDAFNISNDRHEELLLNQITPSGVCLNVEVIEAKDLESKDSYDSASPYVTMYIASLPSEQYNTSVKINTLNPLWNEAISLPLNVGVDDESLIVEVWHAKSSRNNNNRATLSKMKRGMSNLHKKMNKITVTASTMGKDNSMLIGRCSIPLEKITAIGLIDSYDLLKNDKPKHRGSIKLRLSFGAEKNSEMLYLEHKLLLQIILRHELKSSNTTGISWLGEFSDDADAIISHHKNKNRISGKICTLARWSAVTTLHTEQALPFDVIRYLLDRSLSILYSTESSSDDNKIFWDGVVKLLPSCFSVIRKIKRVSDENDMRTLDETLSILSTIAMLTPPKDIDLFPRRKYGWLIKPEISNLIVLNVYEAVEEAIRLRAKDYLFQVNEFRNMHQVNSDENLQNIITVIESVEADLKYGWKHYNKLFKERIKCNYSSICYIYYEKELAENIQAPIQQACKHLNRLLTDPDESDSVKLGTTLFDVLYVELRHFSEFGAELCPDETCFKITEYYEWFADGVGNWLDMKHFEGLKWIEKAIEIDGLTIVDETVKYSSSAIDTRDIFYSIKTIWMKLNWPDIEINYTLMAMSVDKICQCCVCYAQKMFARVESLRNIRIENWCLAINNIDFVYDAFQLSKNELKVEEMISKLAEYHSQADAQRCEETLNSLIGNAIDSRENHISNIIQLINKQICSRIRIFLLDATNSLHRDRKLLYSLTTFVEETFEKLDENLSHTYFNQMMSIISNEIVQIFDELTRDQLICFGVQAERDSHQSFVNLSECLQSLSEYLNFDDDTDGEKAFAEIKKRLRLHSYETRQLIHLYYAKRHEEQKLMQDAPYGQLTIYGHFTNNHLQLNILNARNLMPGTANNLCNPYVQIELVPNSTYECDIPMRYKTKSIKMTNCPLFDKIFSIPISERHKLNGDALIMFSIKNDEKFPISSKYVAECFITFNQIADSDRYVQIHLSLIPTGAPTDCEFIDVLKLRKNEKLGKMFQKSIRRKMSNSKSMESIADF